MHIFIAASYSSQVNFETGEVFPEYEEWLEGIIEVFEDLGHTVFNAIRADRYRINDTDPAAAFRLDTKEIDDCDAVVAFVNGSVSAGVQTEVGYAVAKKKKAVLAHAAMHHLSYFNAAMVRAGVVRELLLPLTEENLTAALSEISQVG
jgi:hypothetical protein